MFDSEAFLADYFRPGVRHIVDGTTGSGKTYTVISLLQDLVTGRHPRLGTVVAATNIVMTRRTPSGIEVAYPPGMYPLTTFAEFMRLTGRLLREHGMGRITILMALDEAQNFMLSDQNGSAENLALVKFMANIRKFGICTLFLTPTIRNLVPRIRNFPDDPTAPGSLNVYWHKDPRAAELAVGHARARDAALVQLSALEPAFPYLVHGTSWTVPPDRLAVGQYGYDTLSAADFAVGQNRNGVAFDIKEFLSYCSGKASFEIPKAIEDFFAEWDLRLPPKKGGDGDGSVAAPAVDGLQLRINEDLACAHALVTKEHWAVARCARLLGFGERQFLRYYRKAYPDAALPMTDGDERQDDSDSDSGGPARVDIYNPITAAVEGVRGS